MNKFLVVAALIPTIMLGGCWNKGDGEKVGQINRVAQTGIFCKTWEATIQRGGLNAGTGSLGAAFDFTIENNDELVKKLQYAMDNSLEVKIHYRSEVFSFCRSDSQSHFLTGVEYLTPAAPVAAPAAKEENLPDIKQLTQSIKDLSLTVDKLTSLLSAMANK